MANEGRETALKHRTRLKRPGSEQLVAKEAGMAPELLFNAQQLVIFADAVCAAGRSRLNLTGIDRICKYNQLRSVRLADPVLI